MPSIRRLIRRGPRGPGPKAFRVGGKRQIMQQTNDALRVYLTEVLASATDKLPPGKRTITEENMQEAIDEVQAARSLISLQQKGMMK